MKYIAIALFSSTLICGGHAKRRLVGQTLNTADSKEIQSVSQSSFNSYNEYITKVATIDSKDIK